MKRQWPHLGLLIAGVFFIVIGLPWIVIAVGVIWLLWSLTDGDDPNDLEGEQ